MQCDFCGAKHLDVTKYKCTGKNLGKTVTTTIKMCICCDANTDKEWLADQLAWDKVISITSK